MMGLLYSEGSAACRFSGRLTHGEIPAGISLLEVSLFPRKDKMKNIPSTEHAAASCGMADVLMSSWFAPQ
jgi:hypothetical protein